MRDRAELKTVTDLLRRMSGEDAEPLVLPPDVLGAIPVMRDMQTTLSGAAFEPPIAEQRPEDDLDLHPVRYDAPEHALWMLPHTDDID